MTFSGAKDEMVRSNDDDSARRLDLPTSPTTTMGTLLFPQGPSNEKAGPSLVPAIASLPSSPWQPLVASAKSLRTRNPIRAIVDTMMGPDYAKASSRDGKPLITLALGDPTACRNPALTPCPALIHTVLQALQQPDHAASYENALGMPLARQTIAALHSSPYHTLHADHVVVANGCSGALELALTALLDVDSILLVPEPGFPLYQVIAESHGAHVVHYRLDPENHWQIDIPHVDAILTQYKDTVRAIVVNNPSNPTGAVYSIEHLGEMVRLCERHGVPLVADEIYGDLVWARPFVPLATVAARLGRHVPVITASGIGKQYLLPGWRVGWICFHDNIYGSLSAVEAGAKRLAQVILGASHLAQTVVPALRPDSLTSELDTWKGKLRDTLAQQADGLCRALGSIPCLQVYPPQGAMYAMVRLRLEHLDETIQSDVDFTTLLLREENIMVLPGTCFGMPNSFRVVFCAPVATLEEAAGRIRQFCHRHRRCCESMVP